jgi:hypothetical protein
MATDLESRIQEIEDRNAVERVIVDYCHGFDRHDLDTLLGAFHEDGAYLLGEDGFGDHYGTDAIRTAVVDQLWPALPETHHWNTNIAIDIDGDVANCSSDVGANVTHSEMGPCTVAATYYDTIERRDGRWAIKERKVDIHYFTPVRGPFREGVENDK